MAEIGLSAYQDMLAGLASENKFDEVIAHSRHILKLHPKNLRAYQQLAGALFATARWAEAADVLRRLLGARPNDFATHAQLATSYQNLGQFDKAIWHAERALDQQPNDQATISLIRELYRKHRKEAIDRLQLTASALAQQQIRNNRLHDALETLGKALETQPERIDLQLLRARALWLDGQRMEAAETALDVLDKLPYAIDANRIMTELWLAEQRPSDAQRYLSHIEALDPYLARQLAAGETAEEGGLTLEELDYSSISQHEHSIVDPQWLDRLSEGVEEGAGGLGALFGMDEDDTSRGADSVTADLDDLLSDEQIDRLFSELVIGEPVAAVSEYQGEDELEEILTEMDERGFLDGPASNLQDDDAELQLDEELEEPEAFSAQLSAADEGAEEAAAESPGGALDSDLESLLEELDTAEEAGDWMAEIQQGDLTLDDDESLEYLGDFDREWVMNGDSEEAAGAPWLSAALREAIDKEEDGVFDLFSDDEQLKGLLKETSDTEPIMAADIENWLNTEEAGDSNEADAGLANLDDELLSLPPARSWLDDDDADLGAAELDDPNQLNAELIDSWQSELAVDDDDDDDPYVDWLSDASGAASDELSMLSAASEADATIQAESHAGQARAWGLDDADQLADFVEEGAAQSAASNDWLNAVVPGLDRENDAATDDVNEYARPTSASGKEFAWVSDIVDEETGEMKAVDPAEIVYFRFSNPPAWLTMMQAESEDGSPVAGAAALSLQEDIDALDLDDLTFDDYFNFDTPTDKMNAINLDEDTEQLNFVGLDWDDYFDLESPTEKTIAITLDDADVQFDELGIDDDDFEFETTDKASAMKPGRGAGLIDDFGLEDDPADIGRPAWLDYGGLGSDAKSQDSNRDSGNSTL